MERLLFKCPDSLVLYFDREKDKKVAEKEANPLLQGFCQSFSAAHDFALVSICLRE